MGEKEQGTAGAIPGKPSKEQRLAAGEDPTGGEPPDTETTIVKSRSNTKNN